MARVSGPNPSAGRSLPQDTRKSEQSGNYQRYEGHHSKSSEDCFCLIILNFAMPPPMRNVHASCAPHVRRPAEIMRPIRAGYKVISLPLKVTCALDLRLV